MLCPDHHDRSRYTAMPGAIMGRESKSVRGHYMHQGSRTVRTDFLKRVAGHTYITPSHQYVDSLCALRPTHSSYPVLARCMW